MAGNYDVVVSDSNLDLLVESLKDERDFVSEFIDGLYTTIVNASSYWQGQSYISFAELLGSYSNYFYNYLDLLETYISSLSDTTFEAVDQLVQDVKQTVEEIK